MNKQREALQEIPGLMLGDCLNHFADQQNGGEGGEYAQKFINAAREIYGNDEFQVDSNSTISESGDNGEFVLCWKWITNEEAGVANDDD